jgi:hypothetical protein
VQTVYTRRSTWAARDGYIQAWAVVAFPPQRDSHGGRGRALPGRARASARKLEAVSCSRSFASASWASASASRARVRSSSPADAASSASRLRARSSALASRPRSRRRDGRAAVKLRPRSVACTTSACLSASGSRRSAAVKSSFRSTCAYRRTSGVACRNSASQVEIRPGPRRASPGASRTRLEPGREPCGSPRSVFVALRARPCADGRSAASPRRTRLPGCTRAPGREKAVAAGSGE